MDQIANQSRPSTYIIALGVLVFAVFLFIASPTFKTWYASQQVQAEKVYFNLGMLTKSMFYK